MKDLLEQLCCFTFPRCMCPTPQQAQRMEKLSFDAKPMPPRTYCFVNLRQSKGLFFLGSIGALFMALSSAVIVFNPLEMIIKSQLSLREGSFLYDTWKKPPIKVGVKIFIFNVTNSEAFMKGEEKLRVQEVGPYVYTEELENTKVVFNANNTVTFTPVRKVIEDIERTVGNIKTDVVIVPNMIFLAVASFLADHSFLANMAFNTLMAVVKSQPFLTITVEEYLLTYKDPMVEYAHKLIPETIHFKTFGVLERMFDEGVNVVTMNLNNVAETRPDGRTVKPLSIELFNGSPGLKQWGYEPNDNTTHNKCNILQGVATEGVLFPRKISRNDTFLIYRKAFCRTLEVEFDYEKVGNSGLKEFHYKLPAHAFNSNHPDNRCYCVTPGQCLPSGISDISPCLFNLPIAVSFPHFFNADPVVFKNIEGLQPNAEQHGSTAVIQPDMGIVLKAHSRVQSNLVMRNTNYNTKAAPFNNMVLPLFWVDLFLDDLPPNVTTILSLVVVVAPVVQKAVTFTFATAGVILVAIAALNLAASGMRCWGFNSKSTRGLYKAGYQSVQIIPVVRRESLGAA